AGEDPVVSLAATAMDTFDALSQLAQHDDGLLFAGLQVMFSDPSMRRIVLERRIGLEDAVWATLTSRGASTEDLGLRVAVTTVIDLSYFAVQRWVESATQEPLASILARCLILAPDPARLATGVTAWRRGRPSPDGARR
ncbi:MAG: hypothetical protein ACRDZ2_11250, partial [Ilumatobacteraceae bacterium]